MLIQETKSGYSDSLKKEASRKLAQTSRGGETISQAPSTADILGGTKGKTEAGRNAATESIGEYQSSIMSGNELNDRENDDSKDTKMDSDGFEKVPMEADDYE